MMNNLIAKIICIVASFVAATIFALSPLKDEPEMIMEGSAVDVNIQPTRNSGAVHPFIGKVVRLSSAENLLSVSKQDSLSDSVEENRSFSLPDVYSTGVALMDDSTVDDVVDSMNFVKSKGVPTVAVIIFFSIYKILTNLGELIRRKVRGKKNDEAQHSTNNAEDW